MNAMRIGPIELLICLVGILVLTTAILLVVCLVRAMQRR
jgi:hypothetical protein